MPAKITVKAMTLGLIIALRIECARTDSIACFSLESSVSSQDCSALVSQLACDGRSGQAPHYREANQYGRHTLTGIKIHCQPW